MIHKIIKYSKNSIRLLKQSLENGNIIAVPTDTVYGLIADAYNEKAVNKIFRTKLRPKKLPLIIFVSSIREAKKIGHFSKYDELLASIKSKKVEEKEEKVREKNEVEIVKESYTKLKDATMDMVQNNPILSDKYLMTPESKEKMRKEFFLEKSLSFLATKYIKQFGVDSFDGVVKDTKLSKDYITSIRDCVVVAA